MQKSTIASNNVRLPAPKRGEALFVTHYAGGRVRAVVLHPDDFSLVETLVDAYESRPPSELGLSDLALRGHALTEERGGVEDDSYYADLALALELA